MRRGVGSARKRAIRGDAGRGGGSLRETATVTRLRGLYRADHRRHLHRANGVSDRRHHPGGKIRLLWDPQLGVDALRAGHALLGALWYYDETLRVGAPHDLLGERFLLVTTVGSGGNIAVPGIFELSLIQKLLPGDDLDAAATALREITAKVSEEFGVSAEVPEYWTIFSRTKAVEVSRAVSAQGRTQQVLLRIWDHGDIFYPGHEGGFQLDDLSETIDFVNGLDGLRFAGLTTFPALLFDSATRKVAPTSNVETLARGVEAALAHLGPGAHVEVNAPGTTSTAV